MLKSVKSLPCSVKEALVSSTLLLRNSNSCPAACLCGLKTHGYLNVDIVPCQLFTLRPDLFIQGLKSFIQNFCAFQNQNDKNLKYRIYLKDLDGSNEICESPWWFELFKVRFFKIITFICFIFTFFIEIGKLCFI